jgi:sugar lactone lactonase YvrE
VWDPDRQCLWWVDVRRGELHRFDGRADVIVTAEPDETVSAVALRGRGGLLLAVGREVQGRRRDGSIEWSVPCPDGDRLNDGKCDRAGRFVVGSLVHDPDRPAAALYSIPGTREPAAETLVEGLTLSNGLGWSPDGTRFYLIDTATHRVDVFRYDVDTGRVSDRRCLVDLAAYPGNPDGLTVDAEGHLWVAMSGGGCVLRITPGGDVVGRTEVPVSKVTSCTFGGAAMDELYLTTASYGLTGAERRQQGHAGGLFVAECGVTGLPAYRFAA